MGSTITRYGPIGFDGEYPVKGTPFHASMIDGGICVWTKADLAIDDNYVSVKLVKDDVEYGDGDHVATVIEGPWVWHVVTSAIPPIDKTSDKPTKYKTAKK